MALPIVGEFFSTVYKNPALGISKQDRFRRPDRVTEYDCEEEMQQSQYTEEEEGFFD
jgi:penicillin-binding protein 1A